jgi:hypothetical protein
MGFEGRVGSWAGRVLVLAASLIVGLSGNAALAEDGAEGLAAWDQATVTGFAKELHQNVRNLRDSFEKIAAPMSGSQRTAYYKLRDDLRVFDRVTSGLAESLEKGEGQEETLNRFRRLETTRRDIVEQARRTDLPNTVLNDSEPVRASLQKLRPYYIATPESE